MMRASARGCPWADRQPANRLLRARGGDAALWAAKVRVGVSVWAPGYPRLLPNGIEKDDEFAALIARGIKVFLAVRRELAIGEDGDGAAGTPCIQLDALGKHTG